MSQDKLAELRLRIDELDEQLQSLMNQRGRLAMEVAAAKQAMGESNYYRPAREAEVLRKVMARNQGPLPDATLVRLFRELMSACLALEGPLRVAYLGPAGTYTEAAVYKHFGHAIMPLPLTGIAEVFREVEADRAHFGVVPVENSTEGMVNHTLDMLARSSLLICGEVVQAIHHCLLGRGDLTQVQEVRAHAQSLAQCRQWLARTLPQAHQVAVSSNAEAARQAAELSHVAAIAGRIAAETYQLAMLAENIEDDPENTTRFLVIGKQKIGSTGQDKTSLMLATQNKPGALHRLLAPFAEQGVSMTRIESRPSRRSPWDYNFFVDFEGHAEDARIQTLLRAVADEAMIFKVLGSYPQAVY